MKNNILLVGVGQTGANLVQSICEIDNAYSKLFINTTQKDLMNNQFANIDNTFLIPHADGTGKDKGVSAMYFENNKNSILEKIMTSYALETTVYIFFSFGGGTGSTFGIKLAKEIQENDLGKIVNLVGVVPSMLESLQVHKNTIQTLKEIDANYDNFNTMYLLDNSKREDKTDINREFAAQFSLLMNLSQPNETDTIDESDADRIRNAKGLGAMYFLDDSTEGAVAIASGYKNSIYVDFDTEYYQYAALSLKENSGLNARNIVENLKFGENVEIGYNPFMSMFVTTGIPTTAIKTITGVILLKIKDRELNNQEELEKLKEASKEVLEGLDSIEIATPTPSNSLPGFKGINKSFASKPNFGTSTFGNNKRKNENVDQNKMKELFAKGFKK